MEVSVAGLPSLWTVIRTYQNVTDSHVPTSKKKLTPEVAHDSSGATWSYVDLILSEVLADTPRSLLLSGHAYTCLSRMLHCMF